MPNGAATNGLKIFVASRITAVYHRAYPKKRDPMVRLVLGVIAGYIVMLLFFFAVFTSAYLALGPERVFQPDSYEVSTLWLVIYGLVYFCGGILACVVAAAISRTQRTCQVLAFAVFVAGILLCIPALRESGGINVRAGEVPNMEAMRLAKLPNWMHLLGPAIGAAGVLVLSKRKFGSTA